MSINILVTGANGFLGSNLLSKLSANKNFSLTGVIRSANMTNNITSYNPVNINAIDKFTDWSDVLFNQHLVIHTAAVVHQTSTTLEYTETDFFKVNVEGTLNLASQAAASGVKRFVFISSIGVCGDNSKNPFTENSPPKTHNTYTKSKYDAETRLWELQKKSEMEVVIIRPPMVYGRNAPGSFDFLLNFLMKGIPIPLGCTKNKKSFIGIDNLTDFITLSLFHPSACNELFVVSDDEDVSTSCFINYIIDAIGKPYLNFCVPIFIMKFLLMILKKRELFQSLFGTLQVDITKSKKYLKWAPKYSVQEGVSKSIGGKDV